MISKIQPAISRAVLAGSAATLMALAAMVFAAGDAAAADFPTKAPARPLCAVDGVNGKISGFGGSFARDQIYGADAALSMPLGCDFGLQIDVAGANFQDRFIGSLSGHLFTRDPNKGLFGVYGNYVHWDQFGGVRASHIGPEFELYSGRWTVQGVAGIEFGNTTSGIVNGVTTTYDIKTRFFDLVRLGYYLNDNLTVHVGHGYLGGRHALTLGGEWGTPLSKGVMGALFAEGRIGEGDYRGVWGGARFYFGQSDKTLIRRHREDDPSDWGMQFGGTSNSGATTQTTPAPPPGPT